MIFLIAAVRGIAGVVDLFGWTHFDVLRQMELADHRAELDRQARADIRRINLEFNRAERDRQREWIEGQIRIRELDEPWKGGGR